MFENLEVFRISHALTRYAAAQQALSAQNMANADTPGYTARDLPPFAELVAGEVGPSGLRATRPGHLGADAGSLQSRVVMRAGESDPNGNSVSLEVEMLHAVTAKRQHDRALAIYKSSLGMLRTAIGRP